MGSEGVGGGRTNGSSCASFGSTSHSGGEVNWSAVEVGKPEVGALPGTTERRSEPTELLRLRVGVVGLVALLEPLPVDVIAAPPLKRVERRVREGTPLIRPIEEE